MAHSAALSETTRALLMKVAVPTVVALLWRKGFRNTLITGPRPLNPQAQKFVGTAFTVRTIPVREDLVEAQTSGARPNLQNKAVADIAAGQVLVVAMDGETRTAFMGDIMTTHLLVKGVAGVVLDGGVSDVAAISDIPLPMFCMGSAATPVTSHRFVTELNTPVGIAGVPVLPGDVLMGDANGIAAIPAHMADEIAQLASEREILEEFVVGKVRDGAPLAGTYPPNEATLAEFAAWRTAQGR
ncbi:MULTISPECIES: ribonuclease activity regulator RraA [unclassified Chelatococcus]|jgi:regulator of RNase E activity RraA|uniref:RraA family protein n=1 Tax=unclassified Chelatococcus TaxID=2638111 RepID=UPI001BCE27DE|nr:MULTISPECIES: ribonuclease activity regulator RraA [unclassified Chelatococcus]CAH1654627.1 Regulator of RNase E activity RraA [Hyphomicrobiales bacterium]MBS7742764.1 ribonuclease activity regulator RraA [Chelatococcus sp. HY11]MBX3542118.1 ribonuclease activity regulator RraA [Chelatococcus sp.]MCO5075667.1 ribonuclease activity regulator RraA [Chelatococcus sp.]CAH1694987.1 Regulator of RNase E activity RraA [Hyphomicrobiales bacterium]